MMYFAAIDDNIASAVYGAIFAFRAPGSRHGFVATLDGGLRSGRSL
jgi:hypothetical protein